MILSPNYIGGEIQGMNYLEAQKMRLSKNASIMKEREKSFYRRRIGLGHLTKLIRMVIECTRISVKTKS